MAAALPPSRTLESLAEATVCGLGLGVELLDESEEAAHTSSQLKEAPKTVVQQNVVLLILALHPPLRHPTRGYS